MEQLIVDFRNDVKKERAHERSQDSHRKR
jgi:hypothetical protein